MLNKRKEGYTIPKYNDWLRETDNGNLYIDLTYMRQRVFDNDLFERGQRELIPIHKKVARVLTKDRIIRDIPLQLLNKPHIKELYGELCNLCFDDPVRNTNWDFLFFKNASLFTPRANDFNNTKNSQKKGSSKLNYTLFVKNSRMYVDFWEEEFRRLLYGYEPYVDDEGNPASVETGKPCGIRISGEFYFYLNYSLMLRQSEAKAKYTNPDDTTFPMFCAMDYYWYKELETRENPKIMRFDMSYKKSLVCVKTRRAGFTYKEVSGCIYLCIVNRNKDVIVASGKEGETFDAVKALKKSKTTITHLSMFTPFGVSDIGSPEKNGNWKHIPNSDSKDSFSFTFGRINTKTQLKEGRLTTFKAVGLGDNADNIAGDGLLRLYFEEGGKIKNIVPSWGISRESLKVGSMYRGLGIIFGTGGAIGVGTNNSAGLYELYSKPEAHDLAAFDDIHEYKVEGHNKVGWFVSSLWCDWDIEPIVLEGKEYYSMDSNGNPSFWVANLKINRDRALKRPPNGSLDAYNTFITQKCITASEAFLVTSSSIFPSADLIALQLQIKTTVGFDRLRTIGTLEKLNNVVSFKPDMEHKLKILTSTSMNDVNNEGSFIMYESPTYLTDINGKQFIPDDMYIVSCDPIRLDHTNDKKTSKTSNFSFVVIKNPKYSKDTYDYTPIVASYIGRNKEFPLTYGKELLLRATIFYNAFMTYENDVGNEIMLYFEKANYLHKVLSFPKRLLDKDLTISMGSTNKRMYGHSCGSDQHLKLAESYTYEWLLKEIVIKTRYKGDVVTDESGNTKREGDEEFVVRRILDLIRDELLIEQLIAYSRNLNLDLVSALFGYILQSEHLSDTNPLYRQQNNNKIQNALVKYLLSNYNNP